MRRKVINPTVGMTIEKLRRSKKLTQGNLAEMADVSTTYIGRVERGENMPSDEVLRRIEEALELPPCALETQKQEIITEVRMEQAAEEIKKELMRRDLSEFNTQIFVRVTCAVAEILERFS